MLQVKMEDCLIGGDSSHLVSLLRYEGLTSITLTRLDQLVTKICGSTPSWLLFVYLLVDVSCCLSLSRIDMDSLIQTNMLLWFEAVHDLLTSDLQKNSATLLSLTEEFYDYFLVRDMLGNEVSCCVSHLG
ncbi:hypothetical protein L3Q82_004801 [Scortum barcoo]|uniref:Uncharacterized protein n=1 Tax=Scortum barcoo TaxID=214431 RepID=A0ACB8VHR3_9TELE|nr:hypothetical protein L3Q82_004801 [Scortum barcoo]